MLRTTSPTRLIAFCCLLGGCALPAASDGEVRQITVLYTNDEHGWMEGMEENQGAANLTALWQSREGYTEDGPFLLLSGGDNWTGPAISTWTEGESMVDVMNAMHYDAPAVGNHEFDFGLNALQRRTTEADYPYLSANTRWQDSNEVPTDIGILPYTVKTVNDVSIGIIGLTTRDTPMSTNPVNVVELNFIEYETALRQAVAQVRNHQPDLLFVIAHVCMAELRPLIRLTEDLDIAMMGAGHCNELGAEKVGDTVLLGGGFHFTAYARASFSYDTGRDQLLGSTYMVNDSHFDQADTAVAALVSNWSAQGDAILSERVAYLADSIPRSNDNLRSILIGSWLATDPAADIAITNAGGIRMDLPAGHIDVGTLVALMPFDNTIIAVNLSGEVVQQAIERGSRPVFAGLARHGDRWILERTGEPLRPSETYRVLVNSFMYAGGSNFGMLREADPDGFDTGINYRQPFQDWLQSQGSSESNPLQLRSNGTAL